MSDCFNNSCLKILAIGNSFSVDATTYLYDIARAEGYEKVIVGDLFIGGCTLETHYNNALSGTKAYIYYKNTDGRWTETPDSTVLDGILDEEWDIITIQQASAPAGVIETYSPYLEGLKTFVRDNMRNPECVFGWHMTWAYQKGYERQEFVNYYDNSQLKMYDAICSVVRRLIIPDPDFRFILPVGTAIQNVRNTAIDDNLNRDGFHLNDLGRYIAGYTWLATIKGTPLNSLAYKPDFFEIDNEKEKLIVDAINSAANHPLKS